jgi:uncharacterized protein (DUF697 family)
MSDTIEVEAEPATQKKASGPSPAARATVKKNKAGQQVVMNHALLATAAGALPVPGLDLLGFMIAHLNMVRDLCGVHNVAYDRQRGRAFLTTVATRAGVTMWLRPTLASAVKAIPGVGTAIGSAVGPVTSGLSTFVLGNLLHAHLLGGGDLHSFNAEDYADQVNSPDTRKAYTEAVEQDH